MRALEAYAWPGNVRELENVIERALIVSTGTSLVIDAPLVDAAGGDTPSGTRLDDVQRAHIEAVLRQCGWKIAGKGNAAEPRPQARDAPVPDEQARYLPAGARSLALAPSNTGDDECRTMGRACRDASSPALAGGAAERRLATPTSTSPDRSLRARVRNGPGTEALNRHREATARMQLSTHRPAQPVVRKPTPSLPARGGVRNGHAKEKTQ